MPCACATSRRSAADAHTTPTSTGPLAHTTTQTALPPHPHSVPDRHSLAHSKPHAPDSPHSSAHACLGTLRCKRPDGDRGRAGSQGTNRPVPTRGAQMSSSNAGHPHMTPTAHGPVVPPQSPQSTGASATLDAMQIASVYPIESELLPTTSTFAYGVPVSRAKRTQSGNTENTDGEHSTCPDGDYSLYGPVASRPSGDVGRGQSAPQNGLWRSSSRVARVLLALLFTIAISLHIPAAAAQAPARGSPHLLPNRWPREVGILPFSPSCASSFSDTVVGYSG